MITALARLGCFQLGQSKPLKLLALGRYRFLNFGAPEHGLAISLFGTPYPCFLRSRRPPRKALQERYCLVFCESAALNT